MSFRQYVNHGWHICALAKGEKGPRYPRWNDKGIPADAADGLEGAGLLHALSQTAALDIDDLATATKWLAERGIDLEALLNADDAVQISSGTKNRAKLIYKLSKPLRTLQPADSGLELRCATANGKSVHDALPGSTHPSGRKYVWSGGIMGDWRSLPTIPAPLLGVWRELAEPFEKPQPAAASDSLEQPKPVNLKKLRKAVDTRDPNCEYPEWFVVGGQIHDATGGSEAGLAMWCDWSKDITRKPYPGDDYLRAKWGTMGDCANPATGDALLSAAPSDRDDFEDVPSEVTEAAAQPEKGAGAVRKAAREDLFRRFAYIMVEEEYFDMDRNCTIGDKTIRILKTSEMPYKSGRLMDPTIELMNAPGKTFVEAQAFHPGEQTIFEYEGKKYANSFRAASIPEPIEPMKDELEKINWLFNRIYDEKFREWLRQFFAHMVQYPALKIRTAPLIWSTREGNGKSTIVHTIPKLLAGEAYYQEVDQAGLNSNFNDYLIGKWVIALTEFRAGTRGERAVITKKCERWVADDMIALSIKNGRGCNAPNHMIITASSNNEDAAQIDHDNRKWSVYNMSKTPKMTKAEKAWIFEEFLRLPRARAVLRHYFLNVPITTFNPNEDALITEDRQAMIESAAAYDLELLIRHFEERSHPLDREVVITADVGDYIRKNCIAKPSNNRIGRLLQDPPFNGTPMQFRFGPGVYRAIAFDKKWIGSPGKAIMAHIQGDSDPISLDVKDDLLL
jgi:hypothetical protein